MSLREDTPSDASHSQSASRCRRSTPSPATYSRRTVELQHTRTRGRVPSRRAAELSLLTRTLAMQVLLVRRTAACPPGTERCNAPPRVAGVPSGPQRNSRYSRGLSQCRYHAFSEQPHACQGRKVQEPQHEVRNAQADIRADLTNHVPGCADQPVVDGCTQRPVIVRRQGHDNILPDSAALGRGQLDDLAGRTLHLRL